METNPSKIILIIIIGIIFSFCSYLYVLFLSSSLSDSRDLELSIIELFLNEQNNKHILYLLFSIILHFGAIINLYVKTKDEKYLSLKRFFISSIGVYILMYLTYYQLSKVLVYIAFLASLVSYIVYVIFIQYVYKIKTIMYSTVMGSVVLLIAMFLANLYENFSVLDYVFFMCITILLPILEKEVINN
jgi:hypothetical protein